MSAKGKIKVARTAGFCWGVKRAMDMTLETAKAADGPVYTHGPLIHNPQVIQTLEGKNVFALDDATRLDEGSVIIRTHGVTPQVRRELKEHGLKVSDATCPLVARVQGIIKKHANLGYHTVIVGDSGHAEVTGLLGFTQGRGHVVGTVEEAEALPPMDNVCVVAQTTCDTARYARVAEAIKRAYPDAVVGDTICEATYERQDEVRKLAGEVDLMVVVGGRNSANTNRLAKLAAEEGAQTLLIESDEELDPEYVIRFDSLGLTAGASTPAWMIQRVLNRLEEITADSPAPVKGALVRFLEAVVISHLSVAAGAALMVFANATLAGFGFTWAAAYMAGAYLFSMYVINQLNDTQTFRHNEPEKIRFYLQHRKPVRAAAAGAALTSVAVAAVSGPWVLLAYGFAMALGLGYTVKWFPRSDIVRIHRLKDIPASKDVFVGVGWVFVTVVIPALAAGSALFTAPVAVAAVFTFTVVYIRSVVSDIRDIHGDRLVGRETIPILIGKEATKVFVAALTISLAAFLAASSYFGLVSPFGYLLLVSVGYTALYLALYHWRIISRGVPMDLALDGVFHVTGAIALAWALV